jgi:hypothetical protein
MAMAIYQKHATFLYQFLYILYAKLSRLKGYIKWYAFFFLWLLLVTPVKAEEPAQAVITTTVGETCLNSCITGVGTYTAYNDVVLKAEVSGAY